MQEGRVVVGDRQMRMPALMAVRKVTADELEAELSEWPTPVLLDVFAQVGGRSGVVLFCCCVAVFRRISNRHVFCREAFTDCDWAFLLTHQ